MKLLAYLLQNAGRPVTRLEIKNAIWGSDRNVRLNLVDKRIERLRSRMACDLQTHPIKTVRSVGYLFDADMRVGGDLI